MSVVISIRVPKELKKKMDELRDRINWSEEIRRFIEAKIREFEQMRALEKLEKVLEEIPEGG